MMKRCSKCKVEKPRSEFYAEKRLSRAKDGLKSQCKACHYAGTKDWGTSHPEKMREIRVRCYERHKDAYLVVSSNWKKRNPDRARALHEKWKRENPERLKELMRPARKRWKLAHPEAVLAEGHKRRAWKANAPGSYTEREIQELWAQQSGQCAHDWCRADLSLGCHRDHRIPLSRGGSNFIENIQLLCPTCNTRKANKTPEEFQVVMAKELRHA